MARLGAVHVVTEARTARGPERETAMTTPTVVHAAGVSQFLSLVPRMLGFHPKHSVVVIPFDGSRSLGAMRLDLPDAAPADHLAGSAIGLVCKLPGVDGLAVVVYAGDQGRATGEAIAAAFAEHARRCGLRVVDALFVDSIGWGSCTDPTIAGPLSEIADDSEPLDADQSAGATLPEPDPATAVAIASHRSTALDTVAVGGLHALLESCLTWDLNEIDPLSAAQMIAVLERPALRDIAILQWSHGLEAGLSAFEAQDAWERGEDYPAHLAQVVWGEGERPNLDRVRAALDVVRHVTAHADAGPDRAGALAVAAWLSWALGRSSVALRYATMALEAFADQGLARIMSTMIDEGRLPEWVFAR